MNTYDKYKPSGIEWIGDIPEQWNTKRMRYIAYMKGRIGWQNLRADEFSFEQDLPFLITGMNFKDGKIRWDEVYHISEERYNEAPEIQLQEGDVLMTKDGTIGKLLLLENLPGKTSLNSHLLVIRSKYGDFKSKYLYYQLDSILFKHYIELTKSGTTFFGISQESVSKYPMLLPPIAEQTAIADYLDEKTAEIDKLIANKERLIELLKEERTAIINKAVTRGINADAKLKPSGIDWLGDIPEHWEVKKLKFLLKANKGAMKTGPFGSHLKNSDFQTIGDYKVYNQRNVFDNDFDKGEDFISQTKFNELRGFEIFENDILVTTRGTIGKCAVFPEGKTKGILHPCLIRFQPDETKISNDWIKTYFNESSFFLENVNLLSNATTIEVIYSYNLKEVTIPLPPIEEQKEIVEFIESKTNEIDSTISKIEKEIELIKEYRTALISEVVTGKIKVI
ncbi:MAG: restriction endonuclease subunit S [Pyrinomonadaceae bacterium]